MGGIANLLWKIKKSLTQNLHQGRIHTIRGTTLVHRFLTKPASERAITRLRFHGRTRRGLKSSAVQLRDHVHQTLPHSFPTNRSSLCRTCSDTLLFIVFFYELVTMAVVYSLFCRLSTVFSEKQQIMTVRESAVRCDPWCSCPGESAERPEPWCIPAESVLRSPRAGQQGCFLPRCGTE